MRTATMPDVDAYYREDLARIHEAGFGDYADACAPGVLGLLEPGVDVLEIGCGSGALTKHLIAAGHSVVATDASQPMLDLAAETVPSADLRLLRIPGDPIPSAKAIVSVGHAVNYLSSPEEIETAVMKLADALTDDGLMVIDICDLSYGDARSGVNHATVDGEGWSIEVTTIFEPPNRFIRGMTTNVELPDGTQRLGHETHINVLIDVGTVADTLSEAGFEVDLSRSIGDYDLPDGVYALVVRN
ncbi:MAG: class I SAM-dependent methyltransferase [Actinomycetota bacterium]|nr:class I SAM-dependent methyltransferase [Actinomycetota bacterium]